MLFHDKFIVKNHPNFSSKVYYIFSFDIFLDIPNALFYLPESIGIKSIKKQKRKINFKFSCPNNDCDRVFELEQSLQRHIEYQCIVKKSFKCGYCDYWAYYAFHIVEHLKSKHSTSDIKILLLKENRLVKYKYVEGEVGGMG